MSGLLGNKVAKLKLEVKTRYLAGEPVPSIARDFKVSTRNIYYHLGQLTPDEKALHAKNSALHSIKAKQDRKGVDENGSKKKGKPSRVQKGTQETKTKAKVKTKGETSAIKTAEGKPVKTEDSLSDFISDKG